MLLAPDWLMYLQIIGSNTLYIGLGFGAFTLATFKWIEFISNK